MSAGILHGQARIAVPVLVGVGVEQHGIRSILVDRHVTVVVDPVADLEAVGADGVIGIVAVAAERHLSRGWGTGDLGSRDIPEAIAVAVDERTFGS